MATKKKQQWFMFKDTPPAKEVDTIIYVVPNSRLPKKWRTGISYKHPSGKWHDQDGSLILATSDLRYVPMLDMPDE